MSRTVRRQSGDRWWDHRKKTTWSKDHDEDEVRKIESDKYAGRWKKWKKSVKWHGNKILRPAVRDETKKALRVNDIEDISIDIGKAERKYRGLVWSYD